MLSLPIVVFFYIISLTDYFKDYKTFGKVLPHLFIPLQSLLFSLYLSIDNNEANYKATEYFNFFSLKAIFILLNIYYLTNAIIKYKKHRLKIDHVLSYDKGISFKWIAVFIIGYILFILCFFILNPDSSPYVVYLPLALVLTYLFFQRNKQITVDLSNKEEETESSNNVDKKPNTFNKNNEELKNKLLKIMISKKPYLTSDLTVYELAKILNSNSKYLSVIINKDFNQNFATFINSYRIEEAKALLKDEVSNQLNQTIMELVITSQKLKPSHTSRLETEFIRPEGLLNSNYKSAINYNLHHTDSSSIFGIKQRIKSRRYHLTSSIDTVLKLSVFTIVLAFIL